MKKKVDISKLNKKAPFELPENYFDKLPGIIESRVDAEEDEKATVFDSLKVAKKTPFEVPENYFNKLPDLIQARITEEEDEKAVVFDSIKVGKTLPFEVPKNYFNELPSIIQARALESNKKGRFSFGFAREHVKWALVPALIALLIVSYSAFFSKDAESFNIEDLISQVSSEDLVAYLEASEISTDEIINAVNFEELGLKFEIEESDMLDELDFSEEDMNDILLEFDLEMGV
ncbi:MAG: 3-isopropylmalate dehydratase small subunit [Cyclobacteriaceae bacterium]|jgi:hypothetical protein